MDSLFYVFLKITIICCGMIAGFFLTFSDFLMRSFKMAKGPNGIQVMQILNREISKSITIFLLWITLFLSLFLAVYGQLNISGIRSLLLLSGAIFYFLGVLVVSFLFNIRMNDKLDVMNSSDIETEKYWTNIYVPRWVFWNYIRAISSLASCICFLITLTLQV